MLGFIALKCLFLSVRSRGRLTPLLVFMTHRLPLSPLARLKLLLLWVSLHVRKKSSLYCCMFLILSSQLHFTHQPSLVLHSRKIDIFSHPCNPPRLCICQQGEYARLSNRRLDLRSVDLRTEPLNIGKAINLC